MDEKAIIDKVMTAYKKRYPDWTGVAVSELSRASFSGWLAVVKAKMEGGSPNEEICFVNQDGKVRIFGTTIELIHFIEERANASWLDRSSLFARHYIIEIYA